MFTGMIIASVNSFNNGKADKNGLAPVILNVIAGVCPNRTVISGTVADTMEIETEKTYLFNVIEREKNPQYGRQFHYNKLSELRGAEIIAAAKELGKAEIFQVEAVNVAAPAESFGK
jgi:hypothetical protein